MKAQVLLPKIFNFPFTYNSKTENKIGNLVEVPFGSKKEIGVIWKKNYFEPKGINIKDITKRLAKNSNPHYRAVVNNGLGYHKNMENKYIKLMTRRLSTDRYHEWLLLLNDKNTKQRAIQYAKELCG